MKYCSLNKMMLVASAWLVVGMRALSDQSPQTATFGASSFKDLPVKSYALMEVESGQLLLASQNCHLALPMASLTKLMTMYLVSEDLREQKIQLQDEVLISSEASAMEGSKMFIQAGTRVKVQDLIQGVIVQSGNDASVALAEYLAGTEKDFVIRMNRKAKSLGMQNTHFVNASGLPAMQHYSSAFDIAILAKALITHFPEYYSWYAQPYFTFNGIKQLNRNALLSGNDGVDGMKTGETKEAGYCLVASAVKEKRRLIAVIMGATSRSERGEHAKALLKEGFEQFVQYKIYAKGQPIKQVRVIGGSKPAYIGVAKDFYMTIPGKDRHHLKETIRLNPLLKAPLLEKTIVGQLVIDYRGVDVVSIPLIALSYVPEEGWMRRKLQTIKRFCTLT